MLGSTKEAELGLSKFKVIKLACKKRRSAAPSKACLVSQELAKVAGELAALAFAPHKVQSTTHTFPHGCGSNSGRPLEAIASRLEGRLEAIPSRLEAIPTRLEAIARRLEAIASR